MNVTLQNTRHLALQVGFKMPSELAVFSPLSGFAGGITVRDGTQQRLATLCVCATWRRVDARAQDRCKGTHRPIVVPTCEGRDAAQAAVLQRVRIKRGKRCDTVS